MDERPVGPGAAPLLIRREGLDALFNALEDRGFRLVGPLVRDGAIVYDELHSSADLPAGWTDEQEGGTYRLHRRDDEALFGYAVGPHSWKKYLFPPLLKLWQAERQGDAFAVEPQPVDATAFAFIGVRACELAAIAVQDRTFMLGPVVDPIYAARRQRAFIVAVNCGSPAATCFCVSMGTGPRAAGGYDLALTELLDGGGPNRFTVEVGSEAGAAVMAAVPHDYAAKADVLEAHDVTDRAAARMGRTMDTAGIKELLYRNYDSPSWENVANRCLSCGNCTMVCPTCFCSSVEDTSDLGGDHAERRRLWDSCFTTDHSYIHGGSVRPTTHSEYRQWMTHKLATWIDQFGTSGCVGCGRCVTWCPVGIDITQEVATLRELETADGDDTWR